MSWSFYARSTGIFGSYARGEAGKGSDLDLLVEIDDPKMGLLKLIALENHLSDLLGVKVDLMEKQTLKLAVGCDVSEEWKTYRKPPKGSKEISRGLDRRRDSC